jgi:putative transposase
MNKPTNITSILTAKIISAIFTPMITILLPFLLLYNVRYVWLTLIILTIGRSAWFTLLWKNGYISDFNIKKREERPLFALGDTLIATVVLIISLHSGSNAFIFLSLGMVIINSVFTIISTKYKISGHMTYLTFAILSIYLLTTNTYLLLIAPVVTVAVGWSRIKLKMHTYKQVILGVIVTTIEVLISYVVFF